MEIERLWGRSPGWFTRQGRSKQVDLLAWYRVHADPVGKAHAAKKATGRKFWTG